MRYFMYCDPAGANSSEPVWTIMSERAIVEGAYWDHWSQRMRAKGVFLENSPEFMQERCIEDFCVTHWAVEATPTELQKIISPAPNPDNSTV